MPLDRVKTIGKGWACSINDVLLACVLAGAIGAYLREPAKTRPARRSAPWCRSICARSKKPGLLGNRFGLAPLVLPIGIDNPIERVYAVRRRHERIQGSYQPLLCSRCWRWPD